MNLRRLRLPALLLPLLVAACNVGLVSFVVPTQVQSGAITDYLSRSCSPTTSSLCANAASAACPMNCTGTCPKGLNPAKSIAEIKKLMLERR